MTLLSDHLIETMIDSSGPEDNRLSVAPFDRDMIQPASLDVRVGPTFRVYRNPGQRVEIRDIPEDLTEEVDGRDGFVLQPGAFALGSTLELVTVPNHLAVQFDGRSTLGRLGLGTHVTAGWLDPGFSGFVTVELSNVGPLELVLYPGDPIGQLIFLQLSSPAVRPYGHPDLTSRYQNQAGPTPPRRRSA